MLGTEKLQLEDFGRDEIFVYKKFTYLAREQERGTQYLRKELLVFIIHQRKREAFRSAMFSSSVAPTKMVFETFRQFGRIPCILAKGILDQGDPVFTGVHQNMGFDRYILKNNTKANSNL